MITQSKTPELGSMQKRNEIRPRALEMFLENGLGRG
jgi:hypothetical protein